ncbi:XisH family protein [Anabaena sp. FACHB-1237]|uniref:XisH family protein n=1 Tax=Anabaena sp. FACHB-1237 TaxID=2692769 RepID=UPI001680DC0F|nr:XisH family protein [Anabaena sp. FACHB-1237]MBD2137426.1 XisH family protein [Anabaena sp. FACHB-1237]
MSAKDKFHEVVKTALIKDNWLITHDPYPLQAGTFDLSIDLGAEKIIAAEREGLQIAVEIKSFMSPSNISSFYGALGQFIAYRRALKVQDSKRILYLAVSTDIYERFFITSFIQELVTENNVLLLIYNIDNEVIQKWLPLMNTDNI